MSLMEIIVHFLTEVEIGNLVPRTKFGVDNLAEKILRIIFLKICLRERKQNLKKKIK